MFGLFSRTLVFGAPKRVVAARLAAKKVTKAVQPKSATKASTTAKKVTVTTTAAKKAAVTKKITAKPVASKKPVQAVKKSAAAPPKLAAKKKSISKPVATQKSKPAPITKKTAKTVKSVARKAAVSSMKKVKPVAPRKPAVKPLPVAADAKKQTTEKVNLPVAAAVVAVPQPEAASASGAPIAAVAAVTAASVSSYVTSMSESTPEASSPLAAETEVAVATAAEPEAPASLTDDEDHVTNTIMESINRQLGTLSAEIASTPADEQILSIADGSDDCPFETLSESPLTLVDRLQTPAERFAHVGTIPGAAEAEAALDVLGFPTEVSIDGHAPISALEPPATVEPETTLDANAVLEALESNRAVFAEADEPEVEHAEILAAAPVEPDTVVEAAESLPMMEQQVEPVQVAAAPSMVSMPTVWGENESQLPLERATKVEPTTQQSAASGQELHSNVW